MADTRQVLKDNFIVVQPMFEPSVRAVRRVGGYAVFGYIRWSCFAVGFQFLFAGFAVHIGPFMVGFAHIDKFKGMADEWRKGQSA